MIELITTAEIAHVLQVSVPQVWTLVRQGKIPSYRVGRLYRFDLAAVLEAIQEGGR